MNHLLNKKKPSGGRLKNTNDEKKFDYCNHLQN